MPARSNIARYFIVSRIAMKDILGSGSVYISTWVITTVVLAVLPMALYVGAYAAVPRSYPLSSVVWSLAIASLLRLTWRRLAGTMSDDIRSGDIALKFRYPLSYLGYLYADHLGRIIPTTLTILVPCLGLATYLFAGFPPISSPLETLGFAAIMTCGSLVLSTLLYTLMALLSFWMEDAMPVVRIVEKAMVIFGGSIVPIALFPSGARTIIEWIPFTATGFPAQAVSPDFLERAPGLAMIQWIWIIIAGAFVALLWSYAKRRVEVNGG